MEIRKQLLQPSNKHLRYSYRCFLSTVHGLPVLASARLDQSWDETVRHPGAVLLPEGPVLLCTVALVAGHSVDQDNKEERKIPVWQHAVKACDEAPGEGHGKICRVGNLPSTRPPAADEQAAVDGLRLAQDGPWQLQNKRTISVLA